MSAAFDAGLAVLLFGVAAWTVASRDRFAAVVGFVVYGSLLAVAWLRLHAPDVALTEAAIGSGLSGVLLLGAAARLRGGTEARRPAAGLRVLAAALAAAVAAGIGAVVLALPEPAPTLAPLAAEDLDATGLGNAVNAVLMAYRATDTLLEVVVLVLAVVGIWSLAPDARWGGRPWPRHEAAADGVLPFLARALTPVGVVAAVYLLWVGADAPGGGFQGGTVLAALWLLVVLAGLLDAPATSGKRLRLALLAGPAVFLAVGLAGILLAGSFLAYPPGWAKALILTIEFPKTFSIAVLLGLLLMGAPRRSDAA